MLLFQSPPLCFREFRVNLCLRRLEFFQLRKRPEALLVRFAIFQLLLGMQNLQPAQRLQHLYPAAAADPLACSAEDRA